MSVVRGLVATVVSALVAATMLIASPADSADANVTCDALCTRVRAELKVFTDWLSANGAKGYVGEAGWPNTADSAAWNAVADAWYRDADAAGLWTTAWATGEWWPNSYALNTYVNSVSEGSPIDTAKASAAVVEAHPTTAAYMRGVNVNGGEFGAPGWSVNTSTFSNANPGAYNTNYRYDSQGTFDYLASRGLKVVRLPFRWERIQPTLGGALNATELQRLTDAVNRAKAAGLQVIPTAFNYGGYMLHDGTQGVRRTIGTSYVTNAHYADLWSKLSAAFQTNTGVAGYGLMNEPSSMTAASGLTAAQTWEKASQAAVTAIRNRADTKLILVPGYNWSGAQRWSATHPAKWITDSANNHRYEAHHYWDRDNSGQYTNTYAAELLDAAARGYATTTVTSAPTTAAPTTAAPTTSTTAPVGPTVSVSDVSVVEGGNARFTLTLSTPSTKRVTVNYATANGTALAPSDYAAKSGTIAFKPGVTSRVVAVTTVSDRVSEPAESFALNISNPINAAISDGTGVATIAAK